MFDAEYVENLRAKLLEEPPGMGSDPNRPTIEIYQQHEHALVLTWQPGDATKYEIFLFATRVPWSGEARIIGVCCRIGAGTFFMPVQVDAGYLSVDYVHEKGFDYHTGILPHTVRVLTYICGLVTDRPTNINFGRA